MSQRVIKNSKIRMCKQLFSNDYKAAFVQLSSRAIELIIIAEKEE